MSHYVLRPHVRDCAAPVLSHAGQPLAGLPLFAWVGIDMVLWGFISRYLNTVTASGINFVPLMLGAVLLWDFCSRVMQGVTMAFFEDVWSRNFLNFFATPLCISEYIGGLVLSSMATSAVGLAVMLVLATAGFRSLVPDVWPTARSFSSDPVSLRNRPGGGGQRLVLRFGPATEWFIWPIPALLSPFAGCLLSPFHPAARHALDLPGAASGVCV